MSRLGLVFRPMWPRRPCAMLGPLDKHTRDMRLREGGGVDRNPEPRSPDEPQAEVSTATVGLIALAAFGLSGGAAALAASSPFDARYGGVAVAAHVLVIAAPVFAGLYAITRRRATRFGWLLVAAGFAWAPTALAESGNSLLYTLGRIDVWVVELMLIYLVLAFPSGRLETRTARALFGAGVALFAVLYLPTVLFVDTYPVPTPWSGCTGGCPANALMLAGSEPGGIHAVIAPLRDALFLLLLLSVAGVLTHRVMRGSVLVRRTLS